MIRSNATETTTRFGIGTQSILVLVMRILGVLLGVVVAAALSRGLGPEGYGEFAFVLGISTLLSQLADFGFSQTAVKEMSRNPAKTDSITLSTIVLRLSLGLIGALGLSVVALIWFSERDAGLIFIAALFVPLSAAGTVSALLQARLRFTVSSSIAFFKSCLWTAVVLLLMVRGASPMAALLILLVIEQVSIAITWWIALRGQAFNPGKWWHYLLPVSRAGLKLGMLGAGTTVYYRAGSVLVFHYAGAENAGFYAAAFRFLDVAQLVPGVLVLPLLPLLARSLEQRDNDAASRLTAKAVETSLAFSLPLAAAMPFLAPRLIKLVYGQEFARAAELTSILFLAFVFISVGWIGQTVLVASSGPGHLWVLTWLLAAISVIAQITLVPTFGVVAAAWVTVFIESIIGTTVMTLGLRRVGAIFSLRSVRKLLLLTAAFGSSQYLFKDMNLFAALLFGGVVYLGIALWSGLFRSDFEEDLPASTSASETGRIRDV